MAEKRKKAPVRKKKKIPPPHKKWRWRFAKFLLVVACFALVGAIYLVQFLESEARRMGVFPTELVQDAAPVMSDGDMTEHITSDDKQQLDAILQSRSE